MADKQFDIEILIKARDAASKELEKLANKVEGVGTNFQNLNTRTERLGEEMRNLQKSLGPVDERLKSLSTNLGKANKNVDKYRDSTKDATKSIQSLDRAVGKLVDRINSNTGATRRGTAATKESGDAVEKVARADKKANQILLEKFEITAKNEKILRKMTQTLADGTKETREFGKSFERVTTQFKDGRTIITEYTREQEKAAKETSKLTGIIETQTRMAKDGSEQLAKMVQVTDDGTRRTDEFRNGIQRTTMVMADGTKRVREQTDAINDQVVATDDLKRSTKDASNVEELLGAKLKYNKSTGQDYVNVNEKMRDGTIRNKNVTRDYSNTLREAGVDVKKFEKEVEGLGGAFGRLARRADANKQSLRTLALNLQGLQVAFVIKYAQALTTALVGLGGELVSVGASAINAGAAIGGGISSGVLQALPFIGLLGAALVRVGSVFKALNLRNTVMQQEARPGNIAKTGSDAAKQTNQITDANESLANAQRAVTDAQENLNKARRNAVRDLQDLILAEQRARLEAEGSTLALAAAKRQLTNAQQGGDLAALREARLGVRSAGLDVTQARLSATRTAADASQGRSQGVEGSDQVVQAKRGLADANRAAAKSARDLALANVSVDAAQQKNLASADRLNFMLGRLTPSERGLYTALIKVQDAYRKAFRPITDTIIQAFTRAADRVIPIFSNPKILGSFKGLSGEIAKAIDRISKNLTSGKKLGFLDFFTGEAAKNIKPLTDILINLSSALLNIGKAAAPVWKFIIDEFKKLSENILGSTENSKGLKKFFEDGKRDLQAWINLASALWKLFTILFTESRDEGRKGVQGMADDLNRVSDNLDKNRDKVRKFFGDANKVFGDLKKVVGALVKELLNVFDPNTTANFTKVLISIVIPAIGNVIMAMGQFFEFFQKVLSLPIIREIAQWIITVLLLGKGFQVVSAALSGLIQLFDFIIASKIRLFIFGLIAAFLVLSRVINTDGWDKFVKTFEKFLPSGKEVSKLVNQLKEQFKGIGDEFARLFKGNDGQDLAKVFGAVAIVIWQIIKIVLPAFLRGVKYVIGGIIDVILGFVKVLKGIGKIWEGMLSLDPGKILSGFKMVFGGFAQAIIGMIKAVYGPIRGAFMGIFDALPNSVKTAFDSVIDVIKSGLDTVLGLISSLLNLPSKVPGLGKVFDKILPGAKEAAGAIDDLRSSIKSTGKETDKQPDKFDALTRSINGARKGGDRFNNTVNNTKGIVTVSRRPIQRLTETLDGVKPSTKTASRALGTLTTNFGIMGAAAGAVMAFISGNVNAVLKDFGATQLKSALKNPGKFASSAGSLLGSLLGGSFSSVADGTVTDIPTKATGGFIGSPGERGQDKVLALLGRGEAVLNGAQQRVVDGALRMAEGFGLDGLFGRVNSRHSEDKGYPQYARGGNAKSAMADKAKTKYSGYVFPLPQFGSPGRVDRGQDMEASKGYATTVALGAGRIVGTGLGFPGIQLRLTAGPLSGNTVFYGHNAAVKTKIGKMVKAGEAVGATGGAPFAGATHTEIGFMQGFNDQSGSWSGTGSMGGQMMHALLNSIAPQWIPKNLPGADPNFDPSKFAVGGITLANAVASFKKIVAPKMKGNFKVSNVLGEAIGKKLAGAANSFLAKKLGAVGSGAGGGATNQAYASFKGRETGATTFGGPGDPGTGSSGYKSDNLNQKWDSYAELNMGTALGGLPYMAPLWIESQKGKKIKAFKRDIGRGGAAVNGKPRTIDLWWQLAQKLGLPGVWSGLVKVSKAAKKAGGLISDVNENDPVWVMAHGGEMVLNKMQQAALGGKEFLKKKLGFGDNGSVSNAGGGMVTRGYSPGSYDPTYNIPVPIPGEGYVGPGHSDPKKTADAVIRRLLSTFPAEFGGEFIKKIFESLDKMALPDLKSVKDHGLKGHGGGLSGAARIEARMKAMKTYYKDTIDALTDLTADDGPIVGLITAVDNFGEELSGKLSAAQFKFRKSKRKGIIIRPQMDEIEFAEGELSNFKKTLESSLEAVRVIRNVSTRANKAYGRAVKDYDRIKNELRAAISGGGSTSEVKDLRKEAEDYRKIVEDLKVGRRGVAMKLTAARAKAAELAQAVIDKQNEIVEAEVSAIEDRTSRRTSQNALKQKLDQIAGKYKSVVTRTGKNVQFIEDEITALQEARKNASKLGPGAAKKAKKEIDDKLTELYGNLADAMVESVNAMVDLIEKTASDNQGRIDAMKTIAEALGNKVFDGQAIIYELKNVKDERDKLQKILDWAESVGWGELADQLKTKIADLNGQIFTLIGNYIQSAIDYANQLSDDALTRNEFVNRRADITEHKTAGGALLANTMRGAALQSKGGILNQQIAWLQNAKMMADVNGFTGKSAELQLKIEDLTVQLEENTLAIQQNTDQARQITIDAITNKQGFFGGVLDKGLSVSQAIGGLMGSTQNIPFQQGILQQQGVNISNASDGYKAILQKLSPIVGDLSGLHGESLVSRLIDLAKTDTSGFTPEQQTQWQSLINLLLDNEGALAANTSALQTLTGTIDPQSFSTTSWEWFRQAVFDGAGGLLPNYASLVPSMAVGGMIKNDGMIYAHAGETIVPASVASPYSSTGDVNVNLTSPTEVADPLYLGKRIAFELKSFR